MLSGDKTARAISERFGANMYCARRLVRTESAYVANAATKESYSEAGIDKYRFVAVLDNRTSELCAALDGKVFELEKTVAGTNYPPMHPFCRSTTIAVFGNDEMKGMERRAKDENGNTIKVPADMDYRKWYDRFVEGDITIHDNANENLKLTISERLKSEYRKNRNSRNALRKELEPIEKEVNEAIDKSVKSGIMNMKGKMSNVDVRKWYIEQNNRIPELIDRTKPLETQARQACELRNSNRFIARELMADQEVRRKLDIDDPITTFEELVEKKMTDKGLSRDEAIADIVKTATKTRSSVNKSLGLEE